jgi:hypothetical protein
MPEPTMREPDGLTSLLLHELRAAGAAAPDEPQKELDVWSASEAWMRDHSQTASAELTRLHSAYAWRVLVAEQIADQQFHTLGRIQSVLAVVYFDTCYSALELLLPLWVSLLKRRRDFANLAADQEDAGPDRGA